MSSKNYDKSDYNLDLGMVIISNESHIPHPRRSGLVGTSSHLPSKVPMTSNDLQIRHSMCTCGETQLKCAPSMTSVAKLLMRENI